MILEGKFPAKKIEKIAPKIRVCKIRKFLKKANNSNKRSHFKIKILKISNKK
jgi:hypothetical protein